VNAAAIEQKVLAALGRIAPEADLTALDPRIDLRDQLDLDSMDFLNFAIGLHQDFGVDVPEADYGRLRTIADCVAYVGRKQAGGAAGGA
jgi:acyl carrier protein